MRHDRRALIAIIALALVSATALRAEGRQVELAWIRILAGEAEPAVWRAGEEWPARAADAPFAPSAVLSYSALRPGDTLAETELVAKALSWERSLEASGRFSKAAVFVIELPDYPQKRGVIVEASPLDAPLFGGGSAYASMDLPLFGGRRTSLAMIAGANKDAVEYRDDAFRDLPLVLDSRLEYDNDLIDKDSFVGNRMTGSFGLGPRLGPLCSLVLSARGCVPFDSVQDSSAFIAIDADLEYERPSLFDLKGFDLSLSTTLSAYPGSSALRLEAQSSLTVPLGETNLECEAGAGLSSGALDSTEFFDLHGGPLFLLGPEGYDKEASEVELARLDYGAPILHAPIASWLEMSLGPFAFAELARSNTDSGLLAGAGGGLRLKLGSPVNLTMDFGYAIDQDNVSGFVLNAAALTYL